MASALQQLVDSLNRRLRCPVVIDDRTGQQQVYNSQNGRLDESRTHRILTRGRDPDVADYFWSFRDPLPQRPIRIPARPDLGVTSRIYMPICAQEELVGDLWVFDSDKSVSEDDFELVYATAESAALVINREQLLADLERSRERELVRDLLSADQSLRRHAAEELVDFDMFQSGAAVVAVVLKPHHPDVPEPGNSVRAEISRAVDLVRLDLTPGNILSLVRNDHGLMLVPVDDPALRPAGLLHTAHQLHDVLTDALQGQPGWSVLVGIGEEQSGLADSATSYEQALHAIKVATVAPSFGPVTEWTRLGIYRLLSHFPLEELTASALHPGLTELLQQEESHVLVRTLEAYLDSGCDAKQSAAKLYIHRGTLYYRLRRIGELTGADLSSGEDRLALHLSLKLGRLTGMLSGASGPGHIPQP